MCFDLSIRNTSPHRSCLPDDINVNIIFPLFFFIVAGIQMSMVVPGGLYEYQF